MAGRYTLIEQRYSLIDVLKYEDISKVYIASEGRVLSPRELVEKAAKEDMFDDEYAHYIAYKNEIQIKDFITKRNRCIGNSLRFLNDENFCEEEEKENEMKIKAIPFKIKPTIFNILNVLIRDQQWDLVFYVYLRETAGISQLTYKLADENIPRESILDRKMVVLQA